MSTLIPPVRNFELPTYRESFNKWLLGAIRGQRTSGLAQELSLAQEAVSDTLQNHELYVDLSNTRNLSAGTQALGGYLVATESPPEIVQAFRPFSAVTAAGATFEQHEGNLAVRREVIAPTASWLAEADTISEATQQLGLAVASPHRASVFTTYTRQLRNQSDVENFSLQTCTKSIAQLVDKGALTGSGVAGEPGGLYSVPGVGTITYSAAATFSNMLSYVGTISGQDVPDGNIRFIGHTSVRQKLMGVQKFSGSSTTLWDLDETIAGKPAFVTTNIASTALCAGDFTTMKVILWGAARVTVDPFTNATTEKVRVFVTQMADIIVTHPSAFVINSGSVTQ